jgi:hypothetical protein
LGWRSSRPTAPARRPATPNEPPVSQTSDPRRSFRMPLGGGGPILQAATARRSVAPQLSRGRRRRPPDLPGNVPHPRALRTKDRKLLSSANARYRSESGFADRRNIAGGMPPAFRNHLAPTACGTPAPIAASSLDRPAATNSQNCRRSSRPATGGSSCDGRSARRAQRRPARSVRTTLFRLHRNVLAMVLRRPLESTLAALIAMMDHVAGTALSDGHFPTRPPPARRADGWPSASRRSCGSRHPAPRRGKGTRWRSARR